MSYKYVKATLLTMLFICGLVFVNSSSMKANPWLTLGVQESSRVASPQDGRIRPPAGIQCDRNNVTAYAGKVIKYSRRASLVTLSIYTDWDTTETVSLSHSKKGDPSEWFLFRGNAFKKSDWSRIESYKGHLRSNMRATAWVCNDGKKPIIDWQPSWRAD